MTGMKMFNTRSHVNAGSPEGSSCAATCKCNIFLCAAGHDQVQRSSVRGESLFSHHQSFLFHPPVLKPYFHLLVAQVQSVRQLLSFLSVYEFIDHKFILKFSQLWLRVRFPLLSGLHLGRAPWDTWNNERQTFYT